MATEIRMPQLGLTMTEGTIGSWLKKVGDPIAKGEAIVEITTDKLTSEIEAEVDGVLLAIVAEEFEEVPVQGLVAIIGAAGENIDGLLGGGGVASAVVEEAKALPTEVIATKSVEVSEDGRIKASPLAKKIAAKLGVNLSSIQSVAGARIKEKDVLDYYESMSKAPLATPAQSAAKVENKVVAVAASDTLKPLSSMRKVIGKRMKESKHSAPHVTLTTEVNVEKMVALREKLNASLGDVRLSFTDILVKMCTTSLLHYPTINASIDDQNLILHRDVNIGVAVALDDGLIVPVIKNTERKGLKQIALEAKELIGKARDNKLAQDELTGGTFTISNLGSYGIDGFTPIINLPESAILGVGRIVKKPIVNDNDEIVVGSMMVLSLSFDHAVADGALAAQFLSLLKSYIEDPDKMHI